jgi:hypothetical protein
MTFNSDEECYQSFRVVYNNGSTFLPTPESENFQVKCQYDISTKKHIVLWDDILAVHKNILSIRDGETDIPHVQDTDKQMYGMI